MIESLIEQHLKEFKAKNILDVGPGYGNFSRVATLTTGAKKITFIDCNSSVLAFQEEECKKAHIVCESLSMSLDLVELSKIEGTYDLILCQEILEHLINAEEVLAALVHRLSENGQIIITVPTKFSEKLIKLLNPNYMKYELYGHVREYNKHDIIKLLNGVGLTPLVFLPAQPHYFIFHVWIFSLRVKVDGSTGEIFSKDIRVHVGSILSTFTKKFFKLTGFKFWSRLFPRNYFIIAGRI